MPFVFFSLRFARGDVMARVVRLSRVSLRSSSRLIRPVFFLIVIGAGSEERGGDGDDAPFYPARFLLFTVSELMLAA